MMMMMMVGTMRLSMTTQSTTWMKMTWMMLHVRIMDRTAMMMPPLQLSPTTVYANYAEARGKLNALRTARGFYPVVAVVEEPQTYDGGKKGKFPTRSSKGKGK